MGSDPKLVSLEFHIGSELGSDQESYVTTNFLHWSESQIVLVNSVNILWKEHVIQGSIAIVRPLIYTMSVLSTNSSPQEKDVPIATPFLRIEMDHDLFVES